MGSEAGTNKKRWVIGSVVFLVLAASLAGIYTSTQKSDVSEEKLFVPKTKVSQGNNDHNLPYPLSQKILPDYAILVSKKDGNMQLVHQTAPGVWKSQTTFPVATGQNDGNKLVEGDKKTPEGTYFVTDIESGPRIGALYGALIFKLNYPNPADLKAGKTGSGIWIHGVEKGSDLDFTSGCVGLRNEDIVKLIPKIRPATPVVIMPEVSENADLAGILNDSLVINSYSTFLASGKANKDTSHYSRVFGSAREFVQALSETEKIEAAAENNINTATPEVSNTEPTSPAFTLNNAEWEQKILDWAEAWGSGNTPIYGNFYHKDFVSSKGRRKQAFLARKKAIFNNKDSIVVNAKFTKAKLLANGRLSVTIHQDYSAWKGQRRQNWVRYKTMFFAKEGEEWKIIRE